MPKLITIIRAFFGCTKVICHLIYSQLVHTLKALYFNWHMIWYSRRTPWWWWYVEASKHVGVVRYNEELNTRCLCLLYIVNIAATGLCLKLNHSTLRVRTNSCPEITSRWFSVSTWAAGRCAWPQDDCSNTTGGPCWNRAVYRDTRGGHLLQIIITAILP